VEGDRVINQGDKFIHTKTQEVCEIAEVIRLTPENLIHAEAKIVGKDDVYQIQRDSHMGDTMICYTGKTGKWAREYSLFMKSFVAVESVGTEWEVVV
jgi:hypothetical protein